MPDWFFDLLKRVDSVQFGCDSDNRLYWIKCRKGESSVLQYVPKIEVESGILDAMELAAERSALALEIEARHAHP